MEVFVQSRAWERDYYWVKLTESGCVEVGGDPRPDYRVLVGMVDMASTSPSLLLAFGGDGHLCLLVKGLASERRARLNPVIHNSLLLTVPPEQERSLRSIAATLLTTPAGRAAGDEDGFNPPA